MNKRLFFMLLVCGLVFGGIFGFKAFGKKMMNQHFDTMPPPASVVSAAAAQTLQWSNVLEASGTLAAINGTQVTTESGGIVQAIHFESGQPVKAGALLLTLSGTPESADLARLQAQAKLAEANRARREKLFQMDAISRVDVETAQADASAALAAVSAAHARVGQKQIRAPFTGMLGLRQANLGQFLSPGAAIVSLQSLNPIHINFSLPEQAASQVSEGLIVTLNVEAYPGQTFTGKVVAVAPGIDSATRNFQLQAQLANISGELKPGMFGHVRLALPGSQTVVVVPRTAIRFEPYGSSVYVIVPGKDKTQIAHQRFVKTGAIQGDFVQVLEGLKPGEQVATSGLFKLRNDATVIINNEVIPEAKLNPAASDS